MRDGGPRLRRVEIRAPGSAPFQCVIPSLSVRTFFAAAERDGDRNDRKDRSEAYNKGYKTAILFDIWKGWQQVEGRIQDN